MEFSIFDSTDTMCSRVQYDEEKRKIEGSFITSYCQLRVEVLFDNFIPPTRCHKTPSTLENYLEKRQKTNPTRDFENYS